MKKIIFGGGYFKYNLEKMDWERTGEPAMDFLTLIRNTVNVMLGYQGIIAREFISVDGFFVVTVCFGHEFNLKKVIEYLQMKKFLDISFVDLMSLEPLDSKKRPLRLHKTINDVKLWRYTYGDNELELFNEIVRLRNKIDFKKMVRQIKGIWDKEMVKEENAVNQIYSHAEVSIKTWRNYKQYLVNLEEKVTRIREEFRVKHEKTKAKFSAKFRGYSDFGDIIKNLSLKTEHDDYFKLPNMLTFLKEKMESKEIKK